MKTLINKLKFTSIKKKIAGATLVEYALIVALIAVVCIVAIRWAGRETNVAFYKVNSRGWGNGVAPPP